MDEWIAGFSLDNTMFATGSGNTETGIIQLLVFDVATAQPIVDAHLDGLAEELKAADGFILVWSVDWA
jgi:hypothetical protein